MRKLKNLIFWRKSDSAPFGTSETKITEYPTMEKSSTISVSIEAINPTYVQIDPDSGQVKAKLPEEESCEIYRRLISDAPNVPGTGGGKMDPKIQWANKKKLKEGREFIRRNFYSILFAHLVGFLLLIAIRPIQSLLLRTSQTHKKKNSLTFYLNLILQLFKWYDQAKDLAEGRSSEIEEEFLHVRTVLEEASLSFRKFAPPVASELKLGSNKECYLYTAFRDDLRSTGQEIEPSELKSVEKIRVTVNPAVACSQYDLAVAQFAFFGPVFLFPKTFGIFERNPKGIDGFVHIWAVIGHKLGLLEEFNLALGSRPRSADAVRSYGRIFTDIFFFSFKIADDLTFRLWKVLIAGFSRYFLFMRADVMLNFLCKDLFKIYQKNGHSSRSSISMKKNLPSVMNILHKFYYLKLKLTFSVFLRFFLFRVALNANARMMVRLAKFRFLETEEDKKKKEANRVKSLSETTLDKWASCQTIETVDSTTTAIQVYS